jgi:hypothetical protein
LLALGAGSADAACGQHADGLITDPLTWKKFKSEWEGGARDAGKNPGDIPVLVEQFVVVGDKNDAPQAAELWRFLPKGFKKYYNVRDPATMEQRADAEIPPQQVYADQPIGTDPETHVVAIGKLFDSGVSIVNIHSGQQDQHRGIEFYGKSVLPKFAGAEQIQLSDPRVTSMVVPIFHRSKNEPSLRGARGATRQSRRQDRACRRDCFAALAMTGPFVPANFAFTTLSRPPLPVAGERIRGFLSSACFRLCRAGQEARPSKRRLIIL